jgi:hypothetical protein
LDGLSRWGERLRQHLLQGFFIRELYVCAAFGDT